MNLVSFEDDLPMEIQVNSSYLIEIESEKPDKALIESVPVRIIFLFKTFYLDTCNFILLSVIFRAIYIVQHYLWQLYQYF